MKCLLLAALITSVSFVLAPAANLCAGPFASGLRFAQFGITQESTFVQSPYSRRSLPSIDEKALLVEAWS